MCITIRQAEQESQRRRRHEGGFTLPELLVSLVICVCLLQSVGQWSVVAKQSNIRMQQNQQAVLLAQEILAGQEIELQKGWDVTVKQQQIGEELIEWKMTITYETQKWEFYYVGK